MINSKKMLALCATTVAGFSTFGALSQAVFADTPKAGDTVITYDNPAQPADWGLSVPSTINMNKKSAIGSTTTVYSNLKVGIVDDKGGAFSDGTEDRKFLISSQGTGSDGNMRLTADDGFSFKLYGKAVGNQGDNEPATLTSAVWNSMLNKLEDISVSTKKDGTSAAPEQWVQLAINQSDAKSQAEFQETISWTAKNLY